jgi:hypothetical protein
VTQQSTIGYPYVLPADESVEGIESMQIKMVIFPSEDGFNVLVWGKWAQGSMRVRHFENRTTMIALLETLGLISAQQAKDLEKFGFIDSCPLYSGEIDEEILVAHGFRNDSD